MPDYTPDNCINLPSVEQLIRAHDGDCALIYLFSFVRKTFDPEQIALELCMTRAQVDSALEKLQRMGISPFSNSVIRSQPVQKQLSASTVPAGTPQPVKEMPPISAVPAAPTDELPAYSPADIEACQAADPAFRAIIDKAKSIFGKPLTRVDLGRLLGIYRHLGLPAEVVLVLLQHCLDIADKGDGSIRLPTAYTVEREAYAWVHQGICTAAAAEQYAETQKKLHSALGNVRKILEIYDRNLTTSEKNFIASWLSMGFDEAAIGAAYERTLDNTGKRAFPYMDKILRRWHEAGLHTFAEIRAKDSAAPVHSTNSQTGTQTRPFEKTDFGKV